MRSFLKTFARWYSTVRELMKNCGDKVHIEADGDNLKVDVAKGAAAQEVSSAEADEMLAASLSES
jgi:hypothetical protein